MSRLTLPALAALFLASAACSGLRALSPEQLMARAEQELTAWRQNWARAGKPAEGEDADRAERAYDILERVESKHADQVHRETLSLLVGEASFATGRLSQAFSRFKSHLENYPVSERRDDIEKYIFQLGTLWSQRSGSFLGTGIASDDGRALDALRYLVDFAPRSPYANHALRRIGEIELRREQYSDAIATFERIIQGYPESIWVDLAQFRIAEAYLRRVKDPRADRDALLQAETRFRDYLARRAEGAFRPQAEAALAETVEKLAESEFRIGEFYLTVGKWYGARYHFSETVKKYKGTRFAALAAEALAKLPAEPASSAERKGPP